MLWKNQHRETVGPSRLRTDNAAFRCLLLAICRYSRTLDKPELSMTTARPPLHSVWENDEGDRLVVVEVSEPFTEEQIAEDLAADGVTAPDALARETERMRAYFLVTYEESGDEFGMEVDNEQWAMLIEADAFRMTGIESH
jgi:hypothetical protein